MRRYLDGLHAAVSPREVDVYLNKRSSSEWIYCPGRSLPVFLLTGTQRALAIGVLRQSEGLEGFLHHGEIVVEYVRYRLSAGSYRRALTINRCADRCR